MRILTPENQVVLTNHINIGDKIHHGILSFTDYQNPDFYFTPLEFLKEFTAASIVLNIGGNDVVIPLHWSILCTDMEYLHTIPLLDVGGKELSVFSLNPISSFIPSFPLLKTKTIFPSNTWFTPQINDKDLLVVPLVQHTDPNDKNGPPCAFFSASKFEIYKPISDIW